MLAYLKIKTQNLRGITVASSEAAFALAVKAKAIEKKSLFK
jgi:hypothetical protein